MHRFTWKRRLAVLVAGIVAATGTLAVVSTPAAQAGAIRTGAFVGTTRIGTQLNANTTMYAGQYILSPDGRFGLLMQPDSNLVVYNSSAPGAAAVWASNTVGAGPTPELVLQNDGNLVLRSWSTWQVIWQTGTGGQL